MMKISFELLGIEIDADDPGESTQNLGLGAISATFMMAVAGAGAYLYNTARQEAGVTDDDMNILGIQSTSRTLSYNEDLAELDGGVRPIRGSDLDQDTARAGAEVTVYREKVPRDKDPWFGAGEEDCEGADSSPMYVDTIATGNESGTKGDIISDTFYTVITDSDGRAMFTRKFDDLELLVEYVSESLTERPLMCSPAPYATAGRHIEFRIDADSNSDGREIDPADSDVMLYRNLL